MYILIKHESKLTIDCGISGTIEFLGEFSSYKGIDDRILEDLKGYSSVIEDKNKLLENVYKGFKNNETYLEYIVLDVIPEKNEEIEIATYWYIE